MLGSLITGLSLWVLYGVTKGDMIITGANSIGVSLNVFLLILKSEIHRLTSRYSTLFVSIVQVVKTLIFVY